MERLTVTLPASPSAGGNCIRKRLCKHSRYKTILTIARNGSNIDGGTDDVVMTDTEGQLQLL